MTIQPTLINVYRVRVGHNEVIVKAQTADEAIALARRQLALDMPRFYDIIRTLDSTQFEVREAA